MYHVLNFLLPIFPFNLNEAKHLVHNHKKMGREKTFNVNIKRMVQRIYQYIKVQQPREYTYIEELIHKLTKQ